MSDAVAQQERARAGAAESLTERETPRLHGRVLAPATRSRLTNLLIAKSLAETVFVLALAMGFYFVAFNPSYKGWMDRADAARVSGWVADRYNTEAQLEVLLYINGNFAGQSIANQPRPDVVAAGHTSNPLHGFSFDTPPLAPGDYEARVFAVRVSNEGKRRTLQQVGRAMNFRVDAASSTASPVAPASNSASSNASQSPAANAAASEGRRR